MPYTTDVKFTEAKKYTVEYRSTDKKDNVSATKTATFEILAINDRPPRRPRPPRPATRTSAASSSAPTTLTLSATDDATGSGVQKIEYRVNGGAYTTYTAPVAFNTPGTYDVDYRATDKVNNTSALKTISFRILSGAGCTSARSDEFDGTTLGSQWVRHTRNGGTPTTSANTLSSAASCSCRRPTSSSTRPRATTSVGPVNFIGQDLPALGANWTAETQFTVKYTGGWQNVGLIVWQGDNNFFRSSLTHNLNGGNHLRRAVQGQPVDHRGRPRRRPAAT